MATSHSRPGSYYVRDGDVLSVKLFDGETVGGELHGGTTMFPSGLKVMLQVHDDGRLHLVVVFAASQWLPEDTLGVPGAELRVMGVEDHPDTVLLEVAPGRAGDTTSTEGLEVEGVEIAAAYDSAGRLVAFIVPGASRQLPAPFDGAG